MRYNGPTAAVRDQFHQGTNRRAYEMLGAHPVTQDGQEMWHFAVWAPNARAVSLIGEFNQWDKEKTPMQKVYDGTWEVRLPAETFDVKSDPKRYDYPDAAKKLTTYKYCIQAQDGTWQDKADPYGFAMQMRPDTASRIYDLSGYRWGDADWMEARKSYDPYHSPVNIYEMHLGSWRRHKDGTFMTYTEIAEQLVPYLKEMGYTHVEFMPVMEHPLDMSWGYQVSGYYAATARFGEPKELMALIDALHQAGIGVLLTGFPRISRATRWVCAVSTVRPAMSIPIPGAAICRSGGRTCSTTRAARSTRSCSPTPASGWNGITPMGCVWMRSRPC